MPLSSRSPRGSNSNPDPAVISTTVQFTATVTDTFNQGVTWSVVGGSANGAISASGLYTAPATVPTPAQVTIMAVSQKDKARTATAVVTVTATATPPVVTVLISPRAPQVANYGTQQFTATVSGVANTGVTWQVNGVMGGSQSLGFISISFSPASNSLAFRATTPATPCSTPA